MIERRLLVRRSFRITDAGYAKAVAHIEALLADVEGMLKDDRKSLLGGDELNYTDIAFAAMSGLWLMPQGYGGGRADPVRIEAQRAPVRMRDDVSRWTENYPKSVAFIRRLYAE